MKIMIGSEGMGIWGRKVIDYLLHIIYPKIEIEYKNSATCDYIIASHFSNHEPLWNITFKKYIYWSGESYTPVKSIYERQYIYILTTIQSSIINSLYIPYFLYSPHLYKARKYTNQNRKYILAYCNSNKIREREQIFDIFVKNTSDKLCHSYGSCFGSYPSTKSKKVDGGWEGQQLIDTYKDYTFVIAMENKCLEGYITEKILNAFYSGAIPIYWGSSNINEFFNEKAFINVNNFNTFEDCVTYAINMDTRLIKQMTEEPIYNTLSDLGNLLNDNYNRTNDNKVLKEYSEKIEKFLSI
tara:strand:+ start:51 stop:944 length:894 start_codon:yes stop_codon:yes gene_type:complete